MMDAQDLVGKRVRVIDATDGGTAPCGGRNLQYGDDTTNVHATTMAVVGRLSSGRLGYIWHCAAEFAARRNHHAVVAAADQLSGMGFHPTVPRGFPMTLISIHLDFADKFSALIVDLEEWSQATFGTDKDRRLLGPIRHLAKEAKELEGACIQDDPLAFRCELADCFLLILDISRRAGIKPMQLVEAAQEKMKINRSRDWPKPDGDNPVEHIR